jgi:Domain of unknown function (DUF4188)
MASGIEPGRMAGNIEGDFVVFMIGMRINRWWKVHRWLKVAFAMPRMLKELGEHPELGMLGADLWFGRTTIMLSYWRSAEHLMSYATNKANAHLPAWKAFNREVGASGDVGVWHETYPIKEGAFESVYVNMPAFGLAKAGERVPAAGHYATARSRLARKAA